MPYLTPIAPCHAELRCVFLATPTSTALALMEGAEYGRAYRISKFEGNNYLKCPNEDRCRSLSARSKQTYDEIFIVDVALAFSTNSSLRFKHPQGAT